MANTLTSLMKIVKSGTAGRIGGTIVDTFTAGRILAKYKGLTTDVSKRKFASLSVKEMSDFKIASPGKGKLRDQENPEVLGYELDRTTLTPKRNKVDTSKSGDYGADPVGDGTFRMIPSGDIVSFEERNRRLKSAKVKSAKFASLSVKEMSDFKVTVPKVAAPLGAIDNSRDAFKQDTSFYVEYDDENEGFGVFGDSTGFCYLLASNKNEAEAKSDSLNKQKKSAKVKSAKSKRIAASTNEMVENFCFEIEELIGGNTIHQKDPLAVEAKDALEDLNDAVYKAVERYDGTINSLFRKKNDADAEYDQGLRDMRED